MKKILLVEDDPEIEQLLRLHITAPDYQLDVTDAGIEAYGKAAATPFDLYLVDIMLPDVCGLEVCKAIRKKDSQVPIIVLTGRNDEDHKLLAFEIGADDYVTKPFGVQELLARIKAVIRRAEQGRDALANDEQSITFRGYSH